MKIDSLGIQSYQQVNRRDQQAATATSTAQQEAAKVEIPQGETNTSKLAVKAPAGTYAEHLSEPERKALELLFDRFRNSGRFGAAYTADSKPAEAAPELGRVVDVKV